MVQENPKTLEKVGDELLSLATKYNVTFRTDEREWACRTDFPVAEMNKIVKNPQAYGEAAVQLYALGTDHFSQMVGSVIRDSSSTLPQTHISIGSLPTPEVNRELSFRGELMSADADFAHKAYHEVAHVVMFYEMTTALNTLYPNHRLSYSIELIERAVNSQRTTRMPLSQFSRTNFYSVTDLLYEDLAEALAIRLSAGSKWEEYKRLCTNANPQAFGKILPLIEKLYELANTKSGVVKPINMGRWH